MKDQLLQQLRLLKLPGIREHLDARVMEAEANSLFPHLSSSRCS